MHTVAAPAKVLVTGANGFIAVWVVKYLLEKGYTVRGTVRSEAKGEHLLKLFKNYVDAGNFELVTVSDFTKPGAFDEAVKGMDVIEHTASPFHFNAVEPNELIDPAVKGTVGILESAVSSAGPQLKRVVITSSIASIFNPEDSGVLDESNWNEVDVREVREKGKDASAMAKYKTSKTLAEKATWDFYQNHKELTWDLVVINPSYVFGPMIHEVSSADNTSNKFFFDSVLSGKSPDEEEIASFQGWWVDVRDVAIAHVKAIEVEEAGCSRFIASADNFAWKEWFDIVDYLKLPGDSAAGKGKAKQGDAIKFKLELNNSKAKNILGVEFRSKLECAKDMIADFKSRGWVSA